MTTARDAILVAIRATERALAPPVGRAYRRRGTLTDGERVDLFCERVSDYRGEARRIAAADVGETVASICRQIGARRIGIPPALPEAWRPAELELVEDHGLGPHELDALDGVVTACTVAIAETGTLVLAAGPTDGRRALTLIPDLHICVAHAEQIVELVSEALELLADFVRAERCPLTFISGPSATSDIELSRVEGVHGPRTLVVLVVAEETFSVA